MTVIEFFACAPIENMASCFLLKPDKVIFICDGRRAKKRIKAYKEMAERLHFSTVFETKSVQSNSINSIVDCLTEIVKNESECTFDLTGGDELALVAMGIVYERYKTAYPLQMHKYNFHSSRMIDCDGDGFVARLPGEFNLTVKECISLHSGEVCSGTLLSGLNNSEDVDSLWSVCKQNPVSWNKSIGKLSELLKVADLRNNGLSVHLNKEKAIGVYPNIDKMLAAVEPILSTLQGEGLIKEYVRSNKAVSFSFKNVLVKRCMQKSGTVLELKMLQLADASKTKNGAKVFNDCVSGVIIDWDGYTSKDGAEFEGTVNEVDLVIMRGLVPIFVSCKNGGVDDSELYKLHTVAERFGNKYAKKILVASGINKRGQGLAYFLERAKDLGIVVIKDAHKMSDDDLRNKLTRI